MNARSLAEWKAEYFRVSLFTATAFNNPIKDVFSSVFGQEPETISEKLSAGETSAAGVFDDHRVEVKISFNRIDFYQHAANPTGPVIPLLENIDAGFFYFTEKVLRVAGSMHDVIRLAVGMNGLYPTENPSQAYEKIKQLTGFNVEFGRHSDVNFQINVPVASTILDGLKINRISIWNSPSLGVAEVGSNGVDVVRKNNYCGCVSDVNTDGASRVIIESSKIKATLDELSAQLLSIYRDGLPS